MFDVVYLSDNGWRASLWDAEGPGSFPHMGTMPTSVSYLGPWDRDTSGILQKVDIFSFCFIYMES